MTKEEYKQKAHELAEEMAGLEREYSKKKQDLILEAINLDSEYVTTNQQYCPECKKPIHWCQPCHCWWSSECTCPEWRKEYYKKCWCKNDLTSL
jgi:hypothetical protein